MLFPLAQMPSKQAVLTPCVSQLIQDFQNCEYAADEALSITIETVVRLAELSQQLNKGKGISSNASQLPTFVCSLTR